MPGKVYLVGAGPGDPGLLTLRGKTLLERADCVIYDFLANEELLKYTPALCERIFVGKRAGTHTLSQEQINGLLAEKSRQGDTVVRLKGGDPFTFGRGGEEAAALREAGIPFEIVPGISSGIAVPAYAGIPVTHRKVSASVSFVSIRAEPSAETNGSDPIPVFPNSDTTVFLMGTRSLASITSALLKQGRSSSTPVAVIRWGTLPYQETTVGTLGDIVSKTRGVAPPTIVVVGEVVNLRNQLRWYEHLPLFGKRIVITRPREQAEPLREALAERGALPIEMPMIEIRDPDSWGPLDDAIRRLEQFDYLLVTSVNGARKFLARLAASGRDVRDLKGIEIGAIGPATAAELARSGLRADFVPAEYRAEGLVEILSERELQGKSFLIPRARVARDLVPRALRERGARVEVIEAYRTEMPSLQPEEVHGRLTPIPDVITFTSSSTATNFSELHLSPELRQKLAQAKIASIGPVTSETLRRLGMATDIEAKESTAPALISAIESYFAAEGGHS
ncbi:MAG TPA: uroporphyrinogen-III C-methyltransferase [Terriglobia bacterium]|nr:uroporphyrinogen-III C-methyltransferase [Terriglobia bacterium]